VSFRAWCGTIYDSEMTRLVITLLALAVPAAAAAAEPAELARARALYNAGSYDAAIDAAAAARRDPKAEDAAALVLARAHLERFRGAGAPDDLTAARMAFAGVRSAALSARDQLDLLIGLGQTLYLTDSFGAAAELFDTALGHASMLTPRDRGKLLDWWATSLDRRAQTRSQEWRPSTYLRIVDRMEQELRVDAGSATGNYWLVVSARGAGDLDRAWDAAAAGWVRAALGPDTLAVRAELDRVVTEALIPERARAIQPREPEDVASVMRAEWDALKTAWK
jgi:hypothetical protein